MSGLRRFLLLVGIALSLAACREAVSAWANGMTAPHVGGLGPASLPTRESVADTPNYQDCNHNALDGRETDVKTSAEHCGACDHACDGGRCERGTCVERRGKPAPLPQHQVPDAGTGGVE